MSKKYFDELNIFRALVIIWVTLAHSTLLADNSASFTVPNFIHNYAYSFHMEALFLLSGMLFAGKFNKAKSIKDKASIIGERFLRLMVPYFFYTAVSFVLKIFMQDYANNQLQTGFKAFVYIILGVSNPNGGLWFLCTLFYISVIAILINRVDIRIIAPISLLLSILIYANVIAVPYLEVIIYNSAFFFIGLLLMSKSGYEKISDKLKSIKSKALLNLLPIVLIVISLSATYANLYLLKSKFATYLIIFINIVAWYFAALAITVNGKLTNRVTMCIGFYGMDIYMIGYYVQIALRVILYSMLGINAHICSILMLVLPFVVSIPLSKYIIRKFRITNAVMLGDFKSIKRKKENEKA